MVEPCARRGRTSQAARRALTIDAALAAGVDDNHMVEN
jgi:hypothetical protein